MSFKFVLRLLNLPSEMSRNGTISNTYQKRLRIIIYKLHIVVLLLAKARRNECDKCERTIILIFFYFIIRKIENRVLYLCVLSGLQQEYRGQKKE